MCRVTDPVPTVKRDAHRSALFRKALQAPEAEAALDELAEMALPSDRESPRPQSGRCVRKGSLDAQRA